MKMIFIFCVLLFKTVLAQNIQSLTIQFPQQFSGIQIEATVIQVPEAHLLTITSEILSREPIKIANVFYSSAQDLAEYERLFKSYNVGVKFANADQVEALVPENLKTDVISKTEQNTLRTLLIIRCVGLGTGLYVGTESSLGIAAFAGVFNYILMELLYIPNKEGRMPGVEFVSSMVNKVTGASDKVVSMSPRQKSGLSATTNFLINYSMNLAMLIPFVGMTGADFQKYIADFSNPELYYRSTYLAVITTLFMSSWKMAVTRWNQQSASMRVMAPKNQSRLVNGVDFMLSFINPGFWAGNFINQTMVAGIGVSGFVAYFYYDLKARFQFGSNPRSNQCRNYFR